MVTANSSTKAVPMHCMGHSKHRTTLHKLYLRSVDEIVDLGLRVNPVAPHSVELSLCVSDIFIALEKNEQNATCNKAGSQYIKGDKEHLLQSH